MVVLFDVYNLPDDIYETIFATEQQVMVARMLIDEIKRNDGTIGKTEMSLFATRLHEGVSTEADEEEEIGPRRKKVMISYNKRQFYDRILTPMKSMGLVDYDLYKKHYKISEKFNKAMINLGLMWLRELKKELR